MASTYTRLTLLSLVNQAIGQTDLSSVTDDYLNFGMYRVARSHNWRILQAEAEVTVASASMSGAFPTTSTSGATIAVKSIMSARIGATSAVHHIAWIPSSRFDLLYPDAANETTGRPKYACDWNRIVRWYPKANAAYVMKLRINCWPQPMTDDASGFRFDDWCADAVVAACVVETFMATNQHDKATAWLQIFKDKIGAAAAADAMSILPTIMVNVPPQAEPGVNPAGA